tara:strand:+ start:3870 stop:4037 length:168 start_codon:yes stop_codon:yes gene_type:complete
MVGIIKKGHGVTQRSHRVTPRNYLVKALKELPVPNSLNQIGNYLPEKGSDSVDKD